MERLGYSLISVVVAVASSATFAAVPTVMLGAHVGTAHDRQSQEKFLDLENKIGRKLAIDNDHEDWSVFPNIDRVRWDRENGRESMLSWRIILDRNNPAKGCATADAIVAGAYDAQLKKQADLVKALGAPPIMVRFNYEMTNNEENTCFTGFPVKSDLVRAGGKYVAAWKHVVDLFRSAGATNVQWVWAPGNKAFEKNRWRPFFPGNDYVDWIGVDDYNKTNIPRSFAADPGMHAFYAAAAAMGKPLIVAETGAVSDPAQSPDAQSLWLTTARDYLKTHPAIKAFLWWDDAGKYAQAQPNYGGSGYVLQGAGLDAFKAMAQDPYFSKSFAGNGTVN